MLAKAIIGVAVLAVVALLGGFAGYSWCKSGYDKQVIRQQQEDAKTVQRLDTAQKEREKVVVKWRERIKVVKESADCPVLDTPLPDEIVDTLRGARGK